MLGLVDEWGPEKIICVYDQRTGMRGVLVIDNTARGPGKGGTRLQADVSVPQIARLARNMTWKWAAADLFLGGAKAGIVADSTIAGKEEILRAFARKLADQVPREYVFGLDMGLTENDAAIFVDELGDRGAAVGLPRALGGLPYDQLGITGFGVAEAGDAAAVVAGLQIRGARVVIQGFGAVGQAAARRFVELGGIVVGVSTVRGAVIDDSGIDVADLRDRHTEYGDEFVTLHPKARLREDALRVPCDVLVPAAREDIIDADVARETTAQIVVEGANLACDSEALRILHERGVLVVPDVIANAGGAVAAAHAMDGRFSAFRVAEETVFAMTSRKLRENAAAVVAESRSRNITPHEAARGLAMSRVRQAMELRGGRRIGDGYPGS